MKKVLIFGLVILLLCFFVGSLQAIVIATDTRPAEKIDGPVKHDRSWPVALVNGDNPPGITESPGETIGESMYDFQHNAAVGHQIAASAAGNVHAIWMHSDTEAAVPRRIKYRYRDLDGSWGSTNNVGPGPRGGYSSIELHSDGSAVVGYHRTDDAGDSQTQLAKDLIQGFGSFIQGYVDNNSVPTEEIIWPKIAVGPNDICHVLSSNFVQENNNLYYSRSVSGNYQQDGFEEWDPEFAAQTFERIQMLSYAIDASKTSQKVARTFLIAPDHEDGFQRTNDVVFQSSTDGGLTWGELIQITNYNEVIGGELEYVDVVEGPYDFYDPEVHVTDGPMDTFYWQAYPNVEILIDDNDVAHVIWSTHMLTARNDTTFSQTFIGQLMHWDDSTEQSSVVYDDVHENGDPNTYNPMWNDVDEMFDFFYRFGVFEASISDYSIACDSDNNLYVVFKKFFSGDYGPLLDGFAYQMYNGEIMLTYSMDNGATWGSDEFGTAINLTETPCPDCQPGECDSDVFPTIAERLTDNRTVHILYMNDKASGSGVRDEGPYTLNPMKYLTYTTGVVAIEDDSDGDTAAKTTHLLQNRPNPFSKQTAIQYSLANPGNVSLSIYNQAGQFVKTVENMYRQVGDHEVVWDGTNESGQVVSTGVYFYRLETDHVAETKRMIMLK